MESVQSTRKFSRYLTPWLLTQLAINGTWLLNQINALIDKKAIAGPNTVQAAISFGGAFVTGFLVKVWKDLEDDAVRGTANMLRAAPGAAARLLGRIYDYTTQSLTCWWPGHDRMYRREIRYEFGAFNDKGLGLINANRLNLEKVYVDLLASTDVNLDRPNLNPLSQPCDARAPIWRHLQRQRSGSAMAVIGAPGCGKTTLLHHLLLTFAAGRQYRFLARARLPFFIELRRLPDALAHNGDASLGELLQLAIKSDSRYSDIVGQLPPNWIRQSIRRRRCILLLDGLDEIADLTSRRLISSWLDRMVGDRRARRHIFVLAARPAGYRLAPLNRARVFEVQPFSYADTKKFIQRWYHANEVVAHGNRDNKRVRRLAEREADSLLQRLHANRRIGELTSNPLLLTMVCMVHRYRGALPGSRGQLYGEICQVLLERWRQTRGIEERYSFTQKLEILRPIAALMMINRAKDIAQETLIGTIAEPLARIGVPPGAESALGFLQDLQANSGLFVEKESRIWSFAHLSFQEYLCSEHWIANRSIKPLSWPTLVSETWWREAILLFASRTSDASDVVRSTVQSNSPAGLSLAFDLYREKLTIDPALRIALAELVENALSADEKTTFRPAAEAWLAHQQANDYVMLASDKEISGWVTEAEYLLFLQDRSGFTSNFTPVHWTENTIHEGPRHPVLGIPAHAAEAYCEWLDERFPNTKHRLPSYAEAVSVFDKLTSPWLCWGVHGFSVELIGKEGNTVPYSPIPSLVRKPLRQIEHLLDNDSLLAFGAIIGILSTLIAAWITSRTNHQIIGVFLAIGSFIGGILGLIVFPLVVHFVRFLIDLFRRREVLVPPIKNLQYAITGTVMRDVNKAAAEFRRVVDRKLGARPSGGVWSFFKGFLGSEFRASRPVPETTAFDLNKSVVSPVKMRVLMRRALDQLITNRAFKGLFKKDQFEQIPRLASALNRRESGEEPAFEGLRVIRDR